MTAEQVTELTKRVKELQREVDDAATESLQEGYNQALQDLSGVANQVMEITRVLGPAAGLEYLLEGLREKNVEVITLPTGVPHDWLTRWKVELK